MTTTPGTVAERRRFLDLGCGSVIFAGPRRRRGGRNGRGRRAWRRCRRGRRRWWRWWLRRGGARHGSGGGGRRRGRRRVRRRRRRRSSGPGRRRRCGRRDQDGLRGGGRRRSRCGRTCQLGAREPQELLEVRLLGGHRHFGVVQLRHLERTAQGRSIRARRARQGEAATDAGRSEQAKDQLRHHAQPPLTRDAPGRASRPLPSTSVSEEDQRRQRISGPNCEPIVQAGAIGLRGGRFTSRPCRA